MMLIPMLIKDNRSKQKFHIARPTCLASGKGLLGVSGACTHQDHMKSPGSQAIQRKSIPSPAPLPPRRQSCPQASPVDTLALHWGIACLPPLQAGQCISEEVRGDFQSSCLCVAFMLLSVALGFGYVNRFSWIWKHQAWRPFAVYGAKRCKQPIGPTWFL